MATKISSPNEWIIFGAVGTSSRTIWAVLTGTVIKYEDSWVFDVPHDPDDFSRCYALICHFPEWRSRLSEVASIFPMWVPFTREWDVLEGMYHDYCRARAVADEERREHPILAKRHSREAYDKIYSFMCGLREEGMKLDGWVQTSPGSWRKDK